MSSLEKWRKAFRNEECRRYLFGKLPTKISFLVLSWLPKGSKILDLGCGTGRNSIFLAKKGMIVYGVDFLEEAIKEAEKRAEKRNVKIGFLVSDITKRIPFPSSYFDAVISNVVLTSIGRKIKKVASEIFRVLKDDGLLFLYEPSVNDEYYKSYETNGKIICKDDGIERKLFDEEILKRVFSNFEFLGAKENSYKGVMFGRRYKRSFIFAVFRKRHST